MGCILQEYKKRCVCMFATAETVETTAFCLCCVFRCTPCPTLHMHMQDTQGFTRAMKRQKLSSQATAFDAASDVIDLSNDDDTNTRCSHDLSTPTFIKLHGSTSVGGSLRRQTHQACPTGIALLKTVVCLIWHLTPQAISTAACQSCGLNKHQTSQTPF